jgi:hypothetical protein
MGKLENLLKFEDFEKNWNAKNQKSTKRTDVGLDILNENLYMKVMDKEAAGWQASVDKFIIHIKKSLKDNQVKDVELTDGAVTFTIRGRKHRINVNDGSITLWRVKTTAFRKASKDAAGRVREERKRTKTRENIEINIPIPKAEAREIYTEMKEKFEDD